MVSRWKRVKRSVFARWKVLDAKIDPVSRKIMVKVEQQLSENSKIKLNGNMFPSEWMYMKMPYYWKGRVRRTLRNKRNLDSLIGSTVRVPRLEEKYKKQLRKKQMEVYCERKK